MRDESCELRGDDGVSLINVNVHKGNRKDLGRPTTTPIENKEALMKELRK